jgi:hypothetical protein
MFGTTKGRLNGEGRQGVRRHIFFKKGFKNGFKKDFLKKR